MAPGGFWSSGRLAATYASPFLSMAVPARAGDGRVVAALAAAAVQDGVLAGDDVLLVGSHADLAVDVAAVGVGRRRGTRVVAIDGPHHQLGLRRGGVVGPEVVPLRA